MTGIEDARLLLARARQHHQELGRETRRIWEFTSKQIGENEFEYRLRFHREHLPALRPIVADIANNLRHSLDHVAAEAARSHLGEDDIDWKTRERIKFPFPTWDQSLALSTNALDPSVSPAVSTAISEVWATAITYPYYLHVVRVVSGAAKHWELRTFEPMTLALQAFPNAGAPIEIPEDYFAENDQFSWQGPKAEGFNLVEKVSFGDVGYRPETIPMPPSPDTVFNTTATYVEKMIEAVEEAIT